MYNHINILLHIYKAKEIFFLQFYKNESIKSFILFVAFNIHFRLKFGLVNTLNKCSRTESYLSFDIRNL